MRYSFICFSKNWVCFLKITSPWKQNFAKSKQKILLVSAKSLADSHTVCFCHFLLDQKVTKESRARLSAQRIACLNCRRLRAEPSLLELCRDKGNWAIANRPDLQEICHKRNFVKVKLLVCPFAGTAPPSCPWPPHPSLPSFYVSQSQTFFLRLWWAPNYKNKPPF